MRRPVTNAFTIARRGGRNPRGSLAASLCPLQSRLEPAEFRDVVTDWLGALL